MSCDKKHAYMCDKKLLFVEVTECSGDARHEEHDSIALVLALRVGRLIAIILGVAG